jgi:hypothetical protein
MGLISQLDKVLVAAALFLFLTDTLGPSWFAVFEAFQNAGVAASTPTKRGVAQAKGHAGAGQGQKIQQPRQQAAPPLLADADVDPDGIQIRRPGSAPRRRPARCRSAARCWLP